jgi:hypothetical protein
MGKKTLEQLIEKFALATQEDFLAVNNRLDAIEITIETKMATKTDLGKMEEHLLDAISGIEVKKQDFDSLKDDVAELKSSS